MAQGWQVRWLGTADRMEADLCQNMASKLISFVSLVCVEKDKSTDSCAAAYLQRLASGAGIMKAYKPDVVLGMGGYVSGPVVWPRGR